MSDLFYVFGIGLTLLALVVSFFGLRSQGFPQGRGLFAGVLAIFAGLVLATTAFAVVLAREEAEHREHAAEEAEGAHADGQETAADPESEAEAEAGTGDGENIESTGGPPSEEPQEALELSSPEDGALVFQPEQLQGKAGPVAIEYENPSAVPHNVAIEDSGETLVEGEVVTDGGISTAATDLSPGSYVFYCAVPGHREAGMEGELTIK